MLLNRESVIRVAAQLPQSDFTLIETAQHISLSSRMRSILILQRYGIIQSVGKRWNAHFWKVTSLGDDFCKSCAIIVKHHDRVKINIDEEEKTWYLKKSNNNLSSGTAKNIKSKSAIVSPVKLSKSRKASLDATSK